MMGSGLSKWSNELKKPTKSGKLKYTESKPIICDCGGSSPIGGDGAGQASFFYTENFEWECKSCGRIMEPEQRDYDLKL